MKFIVANWKMNGNISDKNEMIKNLKNITTDNKIILCLPFTLLNGENSGITIGAQDVSQHENGAYTGDISAQMLKEFDVKYVIVGHSERRTYHNETNEIVHNKAEMAQKNNIVPIICVGENLSEYESGQTIKSIEKMLHESVPQSGKYIIAYEPYWAIGTNKTPTDDEISNVMNAIRQIVGNDIPLLYGGSVKPSNAQQILSIKNVDGVLVGNASLKIDTFLPIITAAN